MKKFNKYLEEKINKIFILFLWSQPLVDLITSLSVRHGVSFVTIGIIIRATMMLFLGYYVVVVLKPKNKHLIIYLLSILLYIIIYSLLTYFNKGLIITVNEIVYLFKTLYFIFMLLFLYAINKSRASKSFLNYRDLIMPLLIYVILIILAAVTKTNFSSYNGFKIGTVGWFYAANEIGSIIGILSPLFIYFAIKQRKIYIKYIVLALYILCCLIIGTKVPLFAIIITLSSFIILYLIKFVYTKNKHYLFMTFFPFFVCLVFVYFLSPISPAGKNVVDHINNVSKEVIDDEGNHINQIDIENIVMSGRNNFYKAKKELYLNSSIEKKLFGIGIYNLINNDYKKLSVEMDLFDILFNFGLIGFLLTYLFPVILILRLIKKYFTNFIKNIQRVDQFSIIISLILGFSISFISGHVITAPAVSIYIAILLIIVLSKPKEENVTSKNIWIDITNSPHAILYNPIIKRLKNENFNITVTVRDYSQTVGLMDLFKIDYILIGDHKGKNKWKKLWGILERSNDLYWFARKNAFDASLSMSSQTCMIASKLVGIPHMTLYDYEYTMGHHINFRLSDIILTPKGVNEKTLKKYGANLKDVVYYPGLKEQFYIYYYIKELNKSNKKTNILKEKFNISKNQILIVFRPEATVAHYQSNDNNLSFDLIDFLDKHPKKPCIMVLPRIASQYQEYKSKNYKNVILPEEVINGIELVASADLVISAGGTVNREAAAIGVPAYTIYQGGKFGAVDKMLIKTNRMIQIKSKKDFETIKVELKKVTPKPIGKDFSDLYVDLVNQLIKRSDEY